MDHKVITIIDEGTVLLDRLILDDPDTSHKWQVTQSTFCDVLHRHDEWISFQTAEEARQFIKAYSEGAAREFLVRADEWYQQTLAQPSEETII